MINLKQYGFCTTYSFRIQNENIKIISKIVNLKQKYFTIFIYIYIYKHLLILLAIKVELRLTVYLFLFSPSLFKADLDLTFKIKQINANNNIAHIYI